MVPGGGDCMAGLTDEVPSPVVTSAATISTPTTSAATATALTAAALTAACVARRTKTLSGKYYV